MFIKIISIGFSFIIGIIVAFIILAASLLITINETPRSIPIITETLENRLNSIDRNVKFTIKNSIIAWDSSFYVLTLRIYDVSISSDSIGAATIPEIKAKLSLLHLLQGHLQPTDMAVFSPEVHLKKPLASPALAIAGTQEIFHFIKKYKTLLPRSITLSDARIYTPNGEAETLWTLKNAFGSLAFARKQLTLSTAIAISRDNKDTSFSSSMTLHKDGRSDTQLTFTNFSSDTIRQHLPASLASALHGPLLLTGTARITTNSSGNFQHAEFALRDAQGIIAYPEHFSQPFQFHAVKAAGIISDKELTLTQFSCIMEDGTAIEFAGTARSTSSFPELDFSVKVKNFPVAKIAAYWPESFVTSARSWVTSRITHGMAPTASGKFTIKPDYIEQRAFPKGTIDATVEFTDTNLNYYDEMPPIEHAAGTVHFSETDVNVAINSGTLNGGALTNTRIIVPYLTKTLTETKTITVDGHVAGKASELMQFIPETQKDPALNLASIAGTSDTHVKLFIPLAHDVSPTFEAIGFDIHADLNKISSSAITPDIGLTNGSFTIDFDGKTTSLEGEALLNGNETEIEWSSTAIANKPGDSEAIITSIIHSDNAGPLEDIISDGNVTTVLTISTQGKNKRFAIDANFKDAALEMEAFGYSKERGEAASFTAKGRNDGKFMALDTLTFKSSQLSASGNALVAPDFSSIARLELTALQSPTNDLSLIYTHRNDTHSLALKGKNLDLSTINYGKLFDKNSASHEAFKLTANLGTVLMKNKNNLSNLQASLACDTKRCHTMNIAASLVDKNTFTMELASQDARRNLRIRSGNGSIIADALNISNNIKGGKLTIDAVDTGDGAFSGTMVFVDFTLVKTKLLTRILTLSSLNGILDVLQGQGLSFDKLSAPFTFKDSVIKLQHVKAVGGSLGITAEGTVNMRSDYLDLQGTVVPAVYGMNSLLGKVPLIGNALMGGKGQGLIAVNYTVKGSFEDAETTVNPLSMLTPGFLRNLFNIFDKKEPKAAKQN